MSNTLQERLNQRLQRIKTEITQPNDGRFEREARELLKAKYGDRYEILREIGEGRKGGEGGTSKTKVFSVRDTTNGSYLCAKIHLGYAAEHRMRFENIKELADEMGKLDRMVEIFDYDCLEGEFYKPWLLMQLGIESLSDKRDKLRGQGKRSFDLDETVYVGQEVCRAVMDMHSRRKEILDVKTGHVLYMEGGSIRLCDAYETAKDTSVSTTTVEHSPPYSGPEMVKDGYKHDRRSDIYPLGLILYEMATLDYFFNNDENGKPLPVQNRDIMKNDLNRVRTKIRSNITNSALAAIIEGCLHTNYLTDEDKADIQKDISELEALGDQATDVQTEKLRLLKARFSTSPGTGLRYQSAQEVLYDLELLERYGALQAYDNALGACGSDTPGVDQAKALVQARTTFYSGLSVDQARFDTSRILPGLEARFRNVIITSARKAVEAVKSGAGKQEVEKYVALFGGPTKREAGEVQVLNGGPFEVFGHLIQVDDETYSMKDVGPFFPKQG